MLRSMTGYSKVVAEEGDFAFSVGIRSLNHRFLDLQVRLPAGLEPFEPGVRSLVKDHICRGRVEVQVTVERPGSAAVQLDRKLLAAYVAALQELRQELGIVSEPDLVALLRIPGMVTAGGEVSDQEAERLGEGLERAVRQALAGLNEMRAQEGAALERDIRTRLERLAALAASVGQLAPNVPALCRGRLEKRLQEMLGNVELDGARLAQEVAFLASRSDIAEELTRFRSHLDQARQLLEESGEVGKKLDFLLQEMNREANTLLAKTTDLADVGLEISRQAVEMRAEIERLREQAQNIE
jgi:uncharacterized protein (TIGR00255 family)